MMSLGRSLLDEELGSDCSHVQPMRCSIRWGCYLYRYARLSCRGDWLEEGLEIIFLGHGRAGSWGRLGEMRVRVCCGAAASREDRGAGRGGWGYELPR
eukprot:2361470-Pleurochrysis_carterae.AAC.1